MAKRVYTPKPLPLEARMQIARSHVMTSKAALERSERLLRKLLVNGDISDNLGTYTVAQARADVDRDRADVATAEARLRDLMATAAVEG